MPLPAVTWTEEHAPSGLVIQSRRFGARTAWFPLVTHNKMSGEREMNGKAVKQKGARTGWFSARPEDKLCQNQGMASKQKVKFKALPEKPWSSDRPWTVPVNQF